MSMRKIQVQCSFLLRVVAEYLCILETLSCKCKTQCPLHYAPRHSQCTFPIYLSVPASPCRNFLLYQMLHPGAPQPLPHRLPNPFYLHQRRSYNVSDSHHSHAVPCNQLKSPPVWTSPRLRSIVLQIRLSPVKRWFPGFDQSSSVHEIYVFFV